MRKIRYDHHFQFVTGNALFFLLMKTQQNKNEYFAKGTKESKQHELKYIISLC